MTDGATSSGRGRVIWYLIAIVIIFLAGFVPAFLSARHAGLELNRTSAQMSATSEELGRVVVQRDLARLEGKLGKVLYEANRNNFANAAAASTVFFDGLRAILTNTTVSKVANVKDLEAILARRDEITADLARADQAVKPKLADVYASYDAAQKP